MPIEALKLSLIQYIMGLQDMKRLQKLYVAIHKEDDILQRLAKPMRKTLDIEQLKKEQGFQPIDKAQFFQQLDDLQIEEPIDKAEEKRKQAATLLLADYQTDAELTAFTLK